MKRTKICVFITILIGCLVVFSGCKNNTKTTQAYTTKADLLAISALSAGEILCNMDNNSNIAASAYSKVTDPTDAEIDEINQYVQLIDNFVGSNPVTFKEETSDKEDFAKMAVISSGNLSSEKVEYTIYYNETLIEENDDEETEYSVNGILSADNSIFLIEGKKELENDEYEFEFIAKIDNDNYVKFKQEIENDEQEFSYKIVKNGEVISQFALEIEVEDGNNKIKLKTYEANKSIKFHKIVEENNTLIQITVEENGQKTRMKVHAKIDSITGETIYIYKFDSGKTVEKIVKNRP